MRTRSAAHLAVGVMAAMLILCGVGATGWAGTDLFLSEIVVEPGTSVAQGELVFVQAEVRNLGATDAGPFTVRLSWRRVDKPTECGFVVTAVEGLGPRGAQWVAGQIDTVDLVPGTYEVTAEADAAGAIVEDSETNNRAFTLLEILPPQPELHPTRLAFAPASPVEYGDTLQIETEIENTGGIAAGSFVVTFELAPLGLVQTAVTDCFASFPWTVSDPRELAEGAWVPFATVPVPGLARDQSLLLARSLGTGRELADLLWDELSVLPIDGSASEQNAYEAECRSKLLGVLRDEVTLAVRARIGVPLGLQELDPGNNDITGFCSVVPSDDILAELRPVEVWFNRDTPVPYRGRLDVSIKVMNVGGGAAEDFRIALYVQPVGDMIGSPDPVEVSPLHTLGVEETDNSLVESFDLSSSDFPEPGAYELRLVVDPEDDIQESDESNNEMIVGVTIEGSELRPRGLEIGAGPVHVGDTIHATAEIENLGDMAATGFVVAFYIGNRRLDTYYYLGSGLAEDERIRVQGVLPTEDLPAGEYTLRAVVDPDDRLPEVDEGNNEISLSVEILPPDPRLAELHATELHTAPTSPILPSDPVTIEAAIWNTGDIDADHFQVVLDVSCPQALGGGTLVCEDATSDGVVLCRCATVGPSTHTQIVDVPGLPRGAKRTIRFDLPADAMVVGLYEATVWIDPPTVDGSPDGEIEEQDEHNNALSVRFLVGAPTSGVPPTDEPNLVFERLSVDPSAGVSLQDTLVVEGTIRNTGRQPAGPSVAALWWEGASSGPAASVQPVPALPVGASHTISLSISAPDAPGLSTLVGRADADDAIKEQSEGDNEARAAVEATGDVKPDLEIVGLRFSHPLPLLVGVPATVHVTIANSGLLPSGPFQVGYEQAGSWQLGVSQPLELAPNRSIEIVFPLDTTTVGGFTLTFIVDVGTAVDESSELNNVLDDVAFSVVTAHDPVAVLSQMGPGGAVRHLALDRATGVLYAATDAGRVAAYGRGEPPQLRFDVEITGSGSPTVLVVGTGDAVYVGTSAGEILVLDLVTGGLVDQIVLPTADGAVRSLVLGDRRVLYVGTEAGLLAVDQDYPVMQRADELVGPVHAVAVSDLTGFIYALTSSGVAALDPSMEVMCRATLPSGAATAMAASPGKIYVGTDDGHVHAYTPCNGLQAGLSLSWSYPQTGALSGAVRSIVYDLRGADPVYATTDTGAVIALEIDGTPAWSVPFQASAGVLFAPAVDPATRRLHFADEAGEPYVLSGDGSVAFAIDAAASRGVGVLSGFVYDAFDITVAGVTRHVRSFYYGGDNGMIYTIQTDR